jgi:hypothetical protein
MKLLIEGIEPSLITTLIEAKTSTSKGGYYLTGPFAEAVTKNRNGRVYPKSVLESAISKFQPMIEARRAIGELNHPPTPQVNPREASHKIESLIWEDNIVVGRAKIMTEMPTGKIVKALMDEDIQLGMSTRGLGTVTIKNGVNEVQGDYVVKTVDIVTDPSGISCFVNGVMENATWIYEASSDSWKMAEQIKSTIKKITNEQVLMRQAEFFSSFLTSLK